MSRSIVYQSCVYTFLALQLTGLSGIQRVFAENNQSSEVSLSDSTSLAPYQTKPGKSFGFVLAKGEAEGLYCKDGIMKNNCIQDISQHTCPSGFTPKVHISPIANQFTKLLPCSLRGYFIKHSLPLINEKGGYAVRFHDAYARFTSVFCPDHAIDISYSVYCI